MSGFGGKNTYFVAVVAAQTISLVSQVTLFRRARAMELLRRKEVIPVMLVFLVALIRIILVNSTLMVRSWWGGIALRRYHATVCAGIALNGTVRCTL